MQDLFLIDSDINFIYNDFTLRPIINGIKEKTNSTFIFPHFSEYKFAWYDSYLNFGNEFNPDNLFLEIGRAHV